MCRVSSIQKYLLRVSNVSNPKFYWTVSETCRIVELVNLPILLSVIKEVAMGPKKFTRLIFFLVEQASGWT